ncbi:polyribonucleotide nucleotidyltransferase [bacterium]|nr:polyribonucleotide nucleotidyltransferase [bacterium]
MPFGENREIILKTGEVARQAHGAVLAQVGGTVVLAAVVRSNKPAENLDFFPLTVDYREKHYAVGRIPGNFFRREGRPGTPETINARLTDRSIRPLFPDGFKYEVQVYLTILSMDQKNPPAVAALIAASAALSISDIPFKGPVGAVRLGRVDGNLVLNPTFEERQAGDLDLLVAGTRSALNMVESGSKSLTEDEILEALDLAQSEIRRVVEGIDDLVKACGKEKMLFEAPQINPEIVSVVEETAESALKAVDGLKDKNTRETAVSEAKAQVVEKVVERFAAEAEVDRSSLEKQAKEAFGKVYKKHVRHQILETRVRADGRQLDEVRAITITPAFLPMAHGSAVFTRGQTQSLGVVTLGTVGDQQKVDDLMGMSTERFLMHYNFPSYSVGETRRIMGPGRRELGHGMLAQRAIEPILPDPEGFAYTVRIVSEILESNGSSSMASVCSGSLALMDAGVPIKAPVAGIAMGLIKEGDKVAILSDIMGMEDHLGDMDFKVAGTKDGVTALQMDIKVEGLSFEILKQALHQALEGRLHILGKMAEVLPEPREEMSPLAPRIETMKIPVDRIGDLIGPSGKHIRGIVEVTGAQVDVQDDGTVFIATTDGAAMAQARKMVKDLTANVEVGQTYTGKVVRVVDFGAFVELLPKKDGLVHISELDFDRVEKVTDICREGDMMKVKVVDIDPAGKVRLSRKAALAEEPGFVAPEGYDPNAVPSRERSPRSSSDRGGRSGDRGGRSGGGGFGGRGGDRGGRDRGGR